MSHAEKPPLALEVSIGVPSREEALKIARALVNERLAGAANIVPDVTAIFWWQGAVRETTEFTLLLKTLPENFEALRQRVRELHSYVLPGIKAWPVVAGDAEWAAWLREEATGGRAPEIAATA